MRPLQSLQARELSNASSQYERSLAIRIVSLDYCYCRPVAGIDPTHIPRSGAPIPKVCVLRVFGSTPSGQATCIHVHQVFPYFYVRCGSCIPCDEASVQQFVDGFHAALDRYLDARSTSDGKSGSSTSAPASQRYNAQYDESGHDAGARSGGTAASTPHVFSVAVVKSACFYGYNPAEEPFLRVTMLRPAEVAKAAEAVGSGAVLGVKLQPYEAHIPYLLQFKLDWNLYGMAHLVLRAVNFRRDPPPASQPLRSPPPTWRHAMTPILPASTAADSAGGSGGTGSQASARGLAIDAQPWTMQTTPYTWLAVSRGAHNALLPQSTCELEADCVAPDILNRRHAVRSRLADAAPDDRLVESLALIWQEERDRRGGSALPPPPASPQRQPLDVCALVTAARVEFDALVRAEAAKRPQAAATPLSGSASEPHGQDFLATLSPAALVATNPFLPLYGTASPDGLAPSLFHNSPTLTAAAAPEGSTPMLAVVAPVGHGSTTHTLGPNSPEQPAPTVQPQHPQQAQQAPNVSPPVDDPPLPIAPTAPPAEDPLASVFATVPQPQSGARTEGAAVAQVAPPEHPQGGELEEQAASSCDAGPAWQPSQMQSLAAAALACARSGSLGPSQHAGASMPSIASGDLDALPLSQELLDRPRACEGSMALGAWEEEAVLAAVQSSRQASQRSAQQQAEDAAQRAAEAISAQHAAEAQAVLDMFDAGGAAAAAGGALPEEEGGAAVPGDDAAASATAGASQGSLGRFRGAGSSSGDTRDTIEDGVDHSSSLVTTLQASPGVASAHATASPPRQPSRAAPSMGPLPLSPISTPPSQRPGSPGTLAISGPSQRNAARHAASQASPSQGPHGTRRQLPLTLSPTQPRLSSPAALHNPLAPPAGAPHGASDVPDASPVVQPLAKRRLRLAPAVDTTDDPPAASSSPAISDPHAWPSPAGCGSVHAAADAHATGAADVHTCSSPVHSGAPAAAPHSTAAAAGVPSAGAASVAAAAPTQPDRATEAGHGPVPDSPLSIRGIGSAAADVQPFARQHAAPPQAAGRGAAVPAAVPQHAEPTQHPQHAAGAVAAGVPAAGVAADFGDGDAPPALDSRAGTGRQPFSLREVPPLSGQQHAEDAAQPVHSMFRLWGVEQPTRAPTAAVQTPSPAPQLGTRPPPADVSRMHHGARGGRQEKRLHGRRVRLQVPEKKVMQRETGVAAGRTAQQRRRRSWRPLPLPDFILVSPGTEAPEEPTVLVRQRERLKGGRWFRLKQQPPGAASLDASCLDLGVEQQEHLRAFYDAGDASRRTKTFANAVFTIPSNSREEMDPFEGPLADILPSKAHMQRLERGTVAKTTWHVFAKPPPATDLLLGSAARTAHEPAAAGGVATMKMNPNTGALMPAPGNARPTGGASPGSLLGTPSLLPGSAPATAPSTGAQPPRDDSSPLQPFRPPSPKYDERTGGFFTPAPLVTRPPPRTAAATTPAATARAAAPSLPQAELRTSDDGVRTELRITIPAASGPDSGGQHGAGTPAPGDDEPSDDDIPSPKYDETTCFFTRPRSTDQRRRRPPCTATGGPVPSSPQPRAQAAPAHPATPQRPGAPAAPVGSPAVQGLQASAAASAANSPALALLTPGNAFTHLRPHGSVSQLSMARPDAAAARVPLSQAGFRTSVPGQGHQLTILSIEVLAATRGKLTPDPRHDELLAVAFAVWYDHEDVKNHEYDTRVFINEGQMAAAHEVPLAAGGHGGGQVDVCADERALLEAVIVAVVALDADVVVGFDVMRWSLGFLDARSRILNMQPPLIRQIGRCPAFPGVREQYNDEYGEKTAHNLHTSGRVVINIWRAMQTELKLSIYNLEACAAAVLRTRVPEIPHHVLAGWFRGVARWRAVRHVRRRARLNAAMLDQLDLVNRTAELAKTFGIDFYSVISRGSQYRVESMLARLAHTQNYLLISPTKEQVGAQPAMEAMPLVMEPESRFYHDPVLVLDFQSLYPSIVIAYNLCYSTCLGKPSHCAPSTTHPIRFGVYRYRPPEGALPTSIGDVIVSGNGLGFVSPRVRPGVLPRLLREILETRVMVKAAMKECRNDSVLRRRFNARQFALKLIANVTYGYTAAGFSGRMPMAELADAIVGTARATLEATIDFINSHAAWRARVVYGDTDSVFVHLPGRTREEAFRVGSEIAKAITARNPSPIKLKFEKVYMGSILQTKKRYVGHMYEDVRDTRPELDTKGIELVRRDSCPAVAKLLERCLVTLFQQRSLSAVRAFCQRQFARILANRVSVRDFMFAQEVRLGSYRTATVPPAALVAAKCMAKDPRLEPAHGERVRFLVVHGEPGARLVDCVVHPQAFLAAGGRLQLHGQYYITKQILPALDRLFSLLGVDVHEWYGAMAKPQRLLPHKRPLSALPCRPMDEAAQAAVGVAVTTIDQFYASRHCIVCDSYTPARQPLCTWCQRAPQMTAAVLQARLARLERQQEELARICTHCGGGGSMPGVEVDVEDTAIVCQSLECGVYFERMKTKHEMKTMKVLSEVAFELLNTAA
eukprot:jgi/Ulvmu1/2977/UM015_0017.1